MAIAESDFPKGIRRARKTWARWRPYLDSWTQRGGPEDCILRILRETSASSFFGVALILGDWEMARFFTLTYFYEHFVKVPILYQIARHRGEWRPEEYFPWSRYACSLMPQEILFHYMTRKNLPQAKRFVKQFMVKLDQHILEEGRGKGRKTIGLLVGGDWAWLTLNLLADPQDRDKLMEMRYDYGYSMWRRREAKTKNPVALQLSHVSYLEMVFEDYFFGGFWEKAYETVCRMEELHALKKTTGNHTVRPWTPWSQLLRSLRAIKHFLLAQKEPERKVEHYKICLDACDAQACSGQTFDLTWRLLQACIYLEMGWETPYCVEFLCHFPELVAFHPPAEEAAKKLGIPVKPVTVNDERIIREIRAHPLDYFPTLRESQQA